ncbi:MAG TPA: MBL fold metallo-hydrolase [Acidimicrobiales bacterium]|nr:MBL fold metallo-hydrolase [Acidimicrobiales bacterium]
MTSPSPLLHFLGAAGTVTGSRFLVEAGRRRVLVDCGLFQGAKDLRVRNWSRFPVEPASIDAVVLTHAHLDHVGYLPALARDGFAGPVLCTPFTAELADIVLEDSARLQEEEAAYANRAGYSKHRPALPLYTRDDAELALSLVEPVDLGVDVTVAEGVTAHLRTAGHILGAATVELTLHESGRRLLFTGDLGRTNHPLLRPPDDPPAAVDVVVTESTYGNRDHDEEAEALDAMADLISRTAERGGTVVIPAFAVDRTEVVLLALARLRAAGRIPELPVYADSPMALRVLEVYRAAIDERAPELRPLEGDPFAAVGTVREVHTSDESRKLHDLPYPAIIVSASGMATGGRVLHHLARRLPDHRNAVILPGFQAAGTRGRQLADGARAVKMLGSYIPVRAEVLQLNAFSVHADAHELIGWLGRMRVPPDIAFVVHGEEEAADALRARLDDELTWAAVVPRAGERVRIR